MTCWWGPCLQEALGPSLSTTTGDRQTDRQNSLEHRAEALVPACRTFCRRHLAGGKVSGDKEEKWDTAPKGTQLHKPGSHGGPLSNPGLRRLEHNSHACMCECGDKTDTLLFDVGVSLNRGRKDRSVGGWLARSPRDRSISHSPALGLGLHAIKLASNLQRHTCVCLLLGLKACTPAPSLTEQSFQP